MYARLDLTGTVKQRCTFRMHKDAMTRPMRDYRQAFTQMADELRADPRLVVERFELGNPLSFQQIESLESETGYELNADLHAFYAQMDGLQLKWFLNPALSPEDHQHTS